jgi:hypothetical protein
MLSINQTIHLIKPLISEVMIKFFNDSRISLFWAINKAFYVITDLLCLTVLHVMT